MVAIARRDAPAESLEGIFLAGASGEARGAVLAPPHPLYGGSIESPVLTELAFACTQAGLASLRFNWRGVGASAGEPSGEAGDADLDYASALEHLAETIPGPLVGGGYSFGSAAALRAARAARAAGARRDSELDPRSEPQASEGAARAAGARRAPEPDPRSEPQASEGAARRIDRLVLVAPPPALVAPAAIAGAGLPALVLVGEYDSIAPARELVAAFERAPAIELHVIPHADHFFMEGLAEIGRLAAEWLDGERRAR